MFLALMELNKDYETKVVRMVIFSVNVSVLHK